MFLVFGALVGDGDVDAFVEKGKLAQPLGQNIEAVFGGFEHGGIGRERYFGAGLLGLADNLDVLERIAVVEFHVIGLSVAVHLGLKRYRKCVDA